MVSRGLPVLVHCTADSCVLCCSPQRDAERQRSDSRTHTHTHTMLTFYTHHVLLVIHMLHKCVSRGPMRAAVWRSLFFTGFMASVDSQTSWVRRRPPAHRHRFGSRMSFTHQHWAGRTWKDRSVFLPLGEPLLYVRPSAGFTEWSMMESDGGINAADGRGRLWADRERVLCTETRQLTASRVSQFDSHSHHVCWLTSEAGVQVSDSSVTI